MARLAVFAALMLLAAAPAAQAQGWGIVRGEGACETQLALTARRAAAVPLSFRYDGERLVLAFPAPADASLRHIVVDRKRFPLAARQAGPALEVVADGALETALAKGRRISLVWTRGRPAAAQLDGAGPALEQLKDCAEEFRIARLERLAQEEAAEVGVYEGEADLRRQGALAEARRLYQQERLAGLAAGGLLPGEKVYAFDGLDPVVCTPTRSDFVCR